MATTDGTGESAGGDGNLPEFSVGELSAALKRTIEATYAYVRVRGEISGFMRARSGHLYMSLKDESAVLDAVCWRNVAQRLPINPEDGLEVVCTGRLSTYAPRSRYQLVIERLEPAGVGALMALLEERRKALAAEGLFDEDRKRPLPYLPEVIGVVTSPTGAVIRDILHRLADRFPRHVLVWPVQVQGEAAAGQIAAAIAGFNALAPDGPIPRPDLIVVARGGGSVEDLWAFNEEIVVRAVAAGTIPLISAVGHETDTTLIDHVSDRRAPTPTAAAEIAVPVRAEQLAQTLDQAQRLLRAQTRLLEESRRRIDGATGALRRPLDLLAGARQRLDDVAARLAPGMRAAAAARRAGFAQLAASLRPSLLRADCRRRRERVDSLFASAANAQRNRLIRAAERLAAQARLLDSLSYRSVLDRGFALVEGADGHTIARAEATAPGQAVALRFQDGTVGAVIDGKAPARRKTRKPPAKASDQDRLL